MTYDGSSPIRGQGQAGAGQIDGWVRDMGRRLAPSYAPDRTYREPPAIGEAIVRLCREAGGYNHDLVAAQIVKESAGWQSAIVRDKNNPSGLGASNDAPYARAITFDTPEEGIRATIAHLRTYVEGCGHGWWDLDPRADAVPEANLGIARVLADLDGRWAVPGDGYGAGIARLANELLAYPAPGGGTTMRTALPAIQWLPSPNFNAGHGGRRWIVIHTTEGGYEGSINWLRGAAGGTSNRNSSSHYVISKDGERIAQLVREADTAWAAGVWDYNYRGIQIEQEGYAGKGGFSDGLYATTGLLVREIAARWGIPLDRKHVIGHGEIPNQDHTDPGPHYDWDRLMAIARGASVEPAPEVVEIGPFGRHVGHGFRAFYESLNAAGEHMALRVLGWPLSEEFAVEGLEGPVFQVFERGILKFDPSEPDPWKVHVDKPDGAWIRDWAREHGLLP